MYRTGDELIRSLVGRRIDVISSRSSSRLDLIRLSIFPADRFHSTIITDEISGRKWNDRGWNAEYRFAIDVVGNRQID